MVDGGSPRQASEEFRGGMSLACRVKSIKNLSMVSAWALLKKETRVRPHMGLRQQTCMGGTSKNTGVGGVW